MENNFLGIKNTTFKSSKFLILSIPVELTTSFGKGTQFAPENIIFSSKQIEFFDEQFKIEPYKYGIRTLEPLQIDVKNFHSMLKKIENSIKKIVKEGKIIISLGGEHTITYGIIKGFKHFYENFNVLILDAHADLRDKYQN
ncbi:MAG TPA: arginase family protein, partial [Candidatus Ratteibacteria bacterium]|nr:arginase family protein [Candidatus Ratteibacteria bacterium]